MSKNEGDRMISHSVIDLTGGLLGDRSTSDIIALTQVQHYSKERGFGGDF